MPRNKNNFAVFILTNGRPDNVITVDTLRKSGYTGKTYFIIDDEDTTGDKYRQLFGAENVIEFDKKAVADSFDTADTSDNRKAISYARNASFQIAKDLGLDYFLQLDDDYTDFLHRWRDRDSIKSAQIRNFDAVVDAMLTLLEDTGAATVAMSQGGDHIGGVHGYINDGIKRKAMNSFFCRTDNPFQFLGRINEDVNAYVVHGALGHLFLTAMSLQLNQVQTQSSDGGMTEFYKASGTYVKSFYSVMMAPSAVVINPMGRTDKRFHHLIKWDNAVPKIISGKYKKAK
jgi:hypothetical protein